MATIFPTSVPTKRLSASITAASSTIILNNINGWDGNALTTSDFGTKLYAVLRNDANTALELIELDPSTIATGATTGMTVNKRGLKFTGDLTTEVAANKLVWIKNETLVELGSNPPQLLQHFVRTVTSPTIDDLLQYTTVLAPTDDKHITTKKYVDDTTNGGAVSHNTLIVAGNAGETVAKGDLIYMDATDNEWKLTDADTVATIEGVLLGVAQGAGTNGNAITGGVLLSGLDSTLTGLTAGDILYAGNTAGQIQNTAGTTERAIGVVAPGSTTQFYFNPFFLNHITKNQKDALAGTSGTPSSTNKYATADSLINYGSAADGVFDLDGTNTYSKLSKSGNDYTMTADIYASTFTIQSAATLITDGYRLFVDGTLSGTGNVKWGTPNAGAVPTTASGTTGATGAAGGAQGGSGPFKNLAGGGGGAGGDENANGVAGTTGASANPSRGSAGAAGGAGGNNANGSPGSGGAAGTVTAESYGFSVTKWATYDFIGIKTDQTIASMLTSGASGGGGGGVGGDSGTSAGGAGAGGGAGANGGLIVIFARTWAGTFGISNIGGAGGAGGLSAGGGAGIDPASGGGGAGGSGGVNVIIYSTKTWTGSHTLTAGALGAGGAAVNSGAAGVDGTVGNAGTSVEIDADNLI